MKKYKIDNVLLFLMTCSFSWAHDANVFANTPYESVHLNNALKVYPKLPSLNGSFTLLSREADSSQSNNDELISLSVFLSSQQDRDHSILISRCDVDLDTARLKNLSFYFLHINWVLDKTVLECFLHILYDYQNFTTINSSSPVHQNLFGRSAYFVHFSLRKGARPLDACISDFSISNHVLNLSTSCLAADRLGTIDFSNTSSALFHNLDRIDYDATCCSNCDQRCTKIIAALPATQHNTASRVSHVQKTTVTPVVSDHFADASNESVDFVSNAGKHASEHVIQHLTVTHHLPNTDRNVTHVYAASENQAAATVHLHSTPESINLQSIQDFSSDSKNNGTPDWTIVTDTTLPSLYITPIRAETIVAPEFDINATNFEILQHNFVQNQSIDSSKVPDTTLLISTSCSVNPCLNDGICRTKNDSQLSYVCECNSSYYGDRCQHYDYCKNSFGKPACLNGGLCKSLDSSREQDFDVAAEKGFFSCACDAGFSGVRCEVPPSLLTISSTSTATSVSFQLINTAAVLTGKRRPTLSLTSKEIVCEPNPCQHNGTCSPAASLKGFQCNCTEEWSGNDCSQRHIVATTLTSVTSTLLITTINSTLHNIDDGDCRLNKSLCLRGICDDFGQCRCDANHTGKHCEILLKTADPCFSEPCQNNATCHSTSDDPAAHSFTCQCTSGFRGAFCNETAIGASEAQASSSNVGAIVGGVFGVLALLGLAVAGYFLYKYVSKSRKLKGKYNPAKEEMNTVGAHPVPLATLNTGERLI